MPWSRYACWESTEGAAEWVRGALPAPLPTAVGGEHWVARYNEALDFAM
eukprot:COSAG01_NODE_46392_length_400_cov_1.933555_2_plen_48_part_01